MQRFVQIGEAKRTGDGSASLSSMELQDSTEVKLVFMLVEAIKIQLVVGKLNCLLHVLLRGESSGVDKLLLIVQPVSPKEPKVLPVLELCKRLQYKA